MYAGVNLYFGVMLIILSGRVQHDIATNVLFNIADSSRNVMLSAGSKSISKTFKQKTLHPNHKKACSKEQTLT
jgi:hypothetical protein